MKNLYLILLLSVSVFSVTFDLSPTEVYEDHGLDYFIVKINSWSWSKRRYKYKVVDGTAIRGVDFTSRAVGRLVYNAFEVYPKKDIKFTIIDNDDCNIDKEFTIDIYDFNLTYIIQSFVITIYDDDECDKFYMNDTLIKVYRLDTVYINTDIQ